MLVRDGKTYKKKQGAYTEDDYLVWLFIMQRAVPLFVRNRPHVIEARPAEIYVF
jgi:hypothetical protein